MTDRDFDAERRRILRRITVLTWSLWAMAAFMALAGGALLAWIFRGLGGLSFLALWALASLTLVVAPALVHLVTRLSGRRGDGDRDPQ